MRAFQCTVGAVAFACGLARGPPSISTSYSGHLSLSNGTTPVGSANVSVLADADGKLNKVLSVDDVTQESSVTIPQNEWNQSTGADYSRLSGACQFR